MLLPCSCHALAMLLDCVTLRNGLYCPALRLGPGEKVAPIPRDATALLVDAVDPALRLAYRCRPNQQKHDLFQRGGEGGGRTICFKGVGRRENDLCQRCQIWIFLSIYLSIYIYTYTHVYIYIYIYIYTY